MSPVSKYVRLAPHKRTRVLSAHSIGKSNARDSHGGFTAGGLDYLLMDPPSSESPSDVFSHQITIPTLSRGSDFCSQTWKALAKQRSGAITGFTVHPRPLSSHVQRQGEL